MYCYQCEQTAKGQGCDMLGICGKTPEVAALQDLLTHLAKGVALWAHTGAALGVADREADRFVIEALFSTVTNVNFDAERLAALLEQGARVREQVKKAALEAAKKAGASLVLSGPAEWSVPKDRKEQIVTASRLGIQKAFQDKGEVVTGLEELVLYGLKGAAAYADHALILGVEDPEVFKGFHKTLAFLCEKHSVEELTAEALAVGTLNLKVMELLDKANTGAYGHPVPTAARISAIKGKAILISGHDLKDLEELLKQTEGQGVNVYTHGEMLPAHGYPKLKAYKHLAGNYGGAWQDQRKEFSAFPGAILMTTNCIQEPGPDYKGRIFTSGLVAWPGVAHIANRDFSSVIKAAKAEEGFTADEPEKSITVGFGRQAVMNAAGKVIELVKKGAIKRFFLIGGCDGAKSGRNYYTELAESLPQDNVILTLACGKYRFNKLSFGDIEGIPRLLDLGQCNDAYSAIQIAVALAGAFQTDVNGLPLSLVLSWYEQKAVAILLTLLSLGIKNMRLGPSLPAFVKPPVLALLQEKFNLMPIKDAKSDLAAIMG
jgi:hydroxylamine reductase